MPNSIKRLSTTLSILVILSMVLAACGGTTASPTDTPGATGGTDATATTSTSGGTGQATQAPAVATNTTQPSGGTTGGSGPTMKNPDTLTVGAAGDPQSLDPA